MVKLTGGRRERIEKILKAYNIDKDKIDIVALYDSSLSFLENKNLILEQCGISDKQPIDYKAHKEQQYKDLIKEIEQKEEDEKAKLTSTLKQSHINNIQQLIKVLLNSEINGLLLIGESGISKSYTVEGYLTELKKEYDTIKGHITPLQLHNYIFESSKEVIVFDDVIGLFQTPLSIGWLTSALETRKVRTANYHSTSKLLTAPEKYEITKKFIIILNEMPTNIQALISRCYTYDITISLSEKVELLKEFALKNNISGELTEYIITIMQDKKYLDIDIRTLLKLNWIYKNCENWRETILLELKPNEKIRAFLEVQSLNDEMERVRMFTKLTGKSYHTYRRIKQMVRDSIKYD